MGQKQSSSKDEDGVREVVVVEEETDHAISNLPDDCLARVFHFLPSSDRNRCSAVCRRWLSVDAQSRLRLSLRAHSQLAPVLPSILSRFSSLAALHLHCDRHSPDPGLGDGDLLLLARLCPNLAALHLRACRALTDDGLASFAAAAAGPRLRDLSLASCGFGPAGLKAVLGRCPALEHLSLNSLRGFNAAGGFVPVGSDSSAAAASLRSLSLTKLYDGHCFSPLILAAENLGSLKLVHCSGDWDNVLITLADRRPRSTLTEIHLEQLPIRDRGLRAIAACCPNLETLRLIKTLKCTDAGVAAIAEGCKLLRDLYIDGGKARSMGGDESLGAVGDHCPNLQKLSLVEVRPTAASLAVVGGKCRKLERLAVWRCETLGDAEMACIAAKCGALKEMSIKECGGVSDRGLMELGWGCPRLEWLTVKKCRLVTAEGVDSLLAMNKSIIVARGDCKL